jgi:two-component system chemotaxis response regulator CheY
MLNKLNRQMGESLRSLIAEDDIVCRKFLHQYLSKYGLCISTVDGREAVDAFILAIEENKPYDLVCLDIIMPSLDGYEALKLIRDIERLQGIPDEKQVKIIMTTGLREARNVTKAFGLGCVAYAGKPINREKFDIELKKLRLI